MSTKHPAGFPDDLIVAKGLAGEKLSFVTIQKNDRGSWQGGHPVFHCSPTPMQKILLSGITQYQSELVCINFVAATKTNPKIPPRVQTH
jgi:hypothetical protein